MSWWTILLIVYIVGAFIFSIYWERRLRQRAERRRRLHPPSVTFAEKMEALTQQLADASRAVDSTLEEIAGARREQEAALQQLAGEIERLTSEQQELQERITLLEQVRPEVATLFDELVRKRDEGQEKRTRRRDYKLIAISGIVTAVITVGVVVIFG